MKKSEKVFLVEDLTARLADAKSIVLVDITGLKVPDQQKLRSLLKEVDATLSVVKNTLLKRALQASNFKPQTSSLEPALSGQTAIIISEDDPLSPIQKLGKFIKEFEMPKLKLGIVEQNIYDSSGVLALSKIPSREILVGQLLGILNGPAYGLVGKLQGNMVALVYSLSEKIKMQSVI